MSAFGTKRTSQSAELMSAFGGKADIANSHRVPGFPSRQREQSPRTYEMGELKGVELERVLTPRRDDFEHGNIANIPPTILRNLGVA